MSYVFACFNFYLFKPKSNIELLYILKTRFLFRLYATFRVFGWEMFLCVRFEMNDFGCEQFNYQKKENTIQHLFCFIALEFLYMQYELTYLLFILFDLLCEFKSVISQLYPKNMKGKMCVIIERQYRKTTQTILSIEYERTHKPTQTNPHQPAGTLRNQNLNFNKVFYENKTYFRNAI